MIPNYSRPAFQPPNWKPAKGSKVLAKESQVEEETAEEIQAKKEAKRRDGRCRWPERHKCRKGLEGAHIKDKSTGGPNIPENIITVCGWIHRRGPQSIHGKDFYIVPRNKKLGANGPLEFWKRVWFEGRKNEYRSVLVARETAPFVLERD